MIKQHIKPGKIKPFSKLSFLLNFFSVPINQNFKKFFMGFLLLTMPFLHGCMAAIPAASMAVAGVTAGFLTVQVINTAKEQHPDVDFNKDYEETITYNKPFESVFQSSIKTISLLNEQIESTDKETGLINTRKVEFGKKPSAFGYYTGEKMFFQRKTILFNKISASKTEVTVKAFFSRKGSYTEEAEFIDENAASVVRAIFYDKLNTLLKEKHASK